MKETLQRMSALFVMALGVLVILASIVWLLWRAMLEVPPNTARAWALVVTALLPLVAWGGWYSGHTEARGRLAGIDQAVDKVMGAATKAAGLRVGMARAMKTMHRTEAKEPSVVALPDVEIIPRQLPSGEDIIEL
jgi:hypothetical protein